MLVFLLACQNKGGGGGGEDPGVPGGALLPSPEGTDLFSISTNYARAVEDPEAHASALSGASFIAPPQPNNYGAVGLSYPFIVPQGRAGMTPSLALSYSSSGGDGWIGMGWSLGLGAVTRSADYGFLRYDHNDVFLYQGKRLLKVSGPPSSEDGVYRPEVLGEEFLRLELTDSANGGVWKVYDSNGTVMSYGETSQSRIARPDNENKTYAWYFSKAEDRNGNTREAVYDTSHYREKRTLYIEEIKYTGNTNSNHDPLLFARFHTEERDDAYVSKAAGFRMSMDRILTRVEMGYDGDVLWNYELVYENSPTSGRPLLKTVASNKRSTQPEFIYQNTNSALVWQHVHNAYGRSSPSNDLLSESLQVKFFEGDFNGDGISDMVFFNPKDGSWRAAEGRGEGGYNFKNYANGYQGYDSPDEIVFFKNGATGDYDGNGRADIAFYLPQNKEYIVAEHDGEVFHFQSYGRNVVASLDLQGSQWFPGDFDGNGLSDSLLFDEKTGNWTLMYNRGRRFEYLKIGYSFQNLFRDDYSPNQLQNSPSTSDNSSQGKERHKVHFFNGDFNGDGRSDISFYDSRNGKWWVGENTPQPDEAPPFRLKWRVYKIFNAPERALFSHERFSGDYNGDGVTDFLLYDRSNGEWIIGEVLDKNVFFRIFSRLPRAINPNISRWLAGDYNGDGRSDVGFYTDGRLWVGEATGTAFRYRVYSLLSYGGPDEDDVMQTPAPEDEVTIKKANQIITTPSKTYFTEYEYNANLYPNKGEQGFTGCFTTSNCNHAEILIYDKGSQSFHFKSSASGGVIRKDVLRDFDLSSFTLLNNNKPGRFSSADKDELFYYKQNQGEHEFYVLGHLSGTSGENLRFESLLFASVSEGNSEGQVTNFNIKESLYWMGDFDTASNGKELLILDEQSSAAKFVLCDSTLSCTDLSPSIDSSASGFSFSHLLRIGSQGNNRNNKNKFSSFVLPAYGSKIAQIILVDRRTGTHSWYRLSLSASQVDVTKESITSPLILPQSTTQPAYRQIAGTSGAVLYANSTNGLRYHRLHWNGANFTYTSHTVPSANYTHQGYDHNGKPILANGTMRKLYNTASNSLENLNADHRQKIIARPDLLTRVYGFTWLTGDYNGDGLTDIGIFRLAESKWYFALSNGSQPDIIREVKNGVGGTYQFTYTDSTKLDNTGDDNIPDLAATYRVITQIVQSDGLGNRITANYEYGDGYAFSAFINGRRETDYFGFGKFTMSNAYGTRTIREYHNAPYDDYLKNRALDGAIKKETIMGNDNLEYKTTEYDYEIREVSVGPMPSYYVETKKVRESERGTATQTTTSAITLDEYKITKREQSITDHHYSETHTETTIKTESSYETDSASNQRRMTQEIRFKDSTHETRTDYNYDSKGNLTQQVLSYTGTGLASLSNRRMRYEYDDYGNRTKEINASASPNRETRYTYDDDLRQFVKTQTQVSSPDLRTRYKYNYGRAFGEVRETIDPNGNSRYSEFDEYGRPSKTKADDPNGIGAVTLAEYSYSIGRYSKRNVRAPLSAKTTLKSGSSDPDYQVRVYIDGLGREHARVKSAEGGRFTRSGKLEYDEAGRLIAKSQTDWAEESEINEYQSNNREKHPTRYEYDAVGRITKSALPQAEGETEETSITTTYNDPWDIIKTHSGGRSKKITQNARNQTLIIEDSSAENTDESPTITAKMGFCYDIAGNRIHRSDLNSATLTCPRPTILITNKDRSGNNKSYWNYDAFGQLRSHNDPDMGRTSYIYNNFGEVIEQIDANSRATRYSYDRLGRVTTKQLPLSEGTVTYTYDINTGSENAKGRLAKLEDSAQTKTFSYDKLGRTKKEIRNHKTVTHHQLKVNYETEYEYDLLGRLKSIKYPENPVSETRARACYEYGNTSFVKRVQINVDAESLLFTENCNRDIVSNITYNEFGQTKMFRLGNGVETKYTYDIKGRLTRLKSQREEDGSIKIYQDADYAFAIDNNIKSIHNNNSYYQANYAYTYDGLDRLVDSNGSFQEHPNPTNGNDTAIQQFRRAFQYAKNGNLTRKEIFNTQTQEVIEGWDYSYANHAATQIAVNGSSRFRMSYDSVGNLTEKEDLTNNLHKEITYNSYNRISQVRDAANDVVVGTYHYDDLGFRVHKKGYYEKGSTPKNVEIIYPSMFYGIEYVPEDSTADSINNIYLNGIRIAALDQNSAVAYFITDQVDSVNLILDDAGEVLTTTQHLPYGETFVHRGDTDFVPKFNSQELDKESGLYYFNARYYEPEIARFTSADIVIDGQYDTQGWNRFSYTKGNPILYKDPTGHVVDTIVDIASALYDVGSAIKHGVDYIKAKKGSKEEKQAKENLKEDATALIADVVAAVIPGITGAGIAIRVANKAQKASNKELLKLLKKVKQTKERKTLANVTLSKKQAKKLGKKFCRQRGHKERKG